MNERYNLVSQMVELFVLVYLIRYEYCLAFARNSNLHRPYHTPALFRLGNIYSIPLVIQMVAFPFHTCAKSFQQQRILLKRFAHDLLKNRVLRKISPAGKCHGGSTSRVVLSPVVHWCSRELACATQVDTTQPVCSVTDLHCKSLSYMTWDMSILICEL